MGVRSGPSRVTAIGGAETQAVDARALHGQLGVRRDFTTWIKDRVEKYGFADGQDFSTISAPPIRGAGNRGARTDYHLTLDVAKELAMLENNDQGRALRRYFIGLERLVKGRAQGDIRWHGP